MVEVIVQQSATQKVGGGMRAFCRPMPRGLPLTRISHKDMPRAASFSKSLRRKSLYLLDVSSG